MDKSVEIEDIEDLRRRAGIEDTELREAIRGLRVGDHVRLTLLGGTKSAAGKALVVRITRIRGSRFRGRLADGQATPPRPGLRAGACLDFTSAHIHSVAKGRRSHA
jgi:hypothetical protein